MSEPQPLFVACPAVPPNSSNPLPSRRPGTSKREVITRLITGNDLVVDAHAFRPAEPFPVLTVEEAAELLRVEPDVVQAPAEAGDLPARRVGEEWRLSREAVLARLAP